MIVVALFLVGLCLGSFVNALVWRLHEQERSKKKKAKSNELSILHGRSMCPHCKHELAAKDLVPVLSWLELRGRCRYCNTKISWQYPVVELLVAITLVGLYLVWPQNTWSPREILDYVTWAALVVGFAALIVYDLRWMELPNRIVFVLQGIVLLNIAAQLAMGGGLTVLWGAVGGLLAVGGIFYLLFQVSAGKWIGGGDVKLGFVLGAAVGGFLNGLLILFVASCLGLLVSLPMISSHKKGLKSRIPFGPFLIIAAVIVKLFGASIIAWYKRMLVV